MIIYFADRQMNILGQASTSLPKGVTAKNDLKTEDIDTGVATFECDITYDSNTRERVEACCKVGNYILRSNDNETEFYTIIDSEADTKDQSIYIYAEDAGLDLLNEVVGAYAADTAYSIEYYVNKYAYDSGFVIGINEASELTRKLSWEGEATATERIRSVATQFDNCEISYSFDIENLTITKKYINIYKKRGKDNGVQLRLNKEIDRITTKKSIANLATALDVTGGVPENEETPIDLNGYTYDDGNFYISGSRLFSRNALQQWSRYLWANEPEQIDDVGHIVKAYSYDTTSQSELCNRALSELKKICEIEVNYEVDISNLPDNVKIGDTVNIVDDEGELYLSTRLLKIERSIANQTSKATLGDYLIKGSGISQKVIELAAQFAKNSQSAKRALEIANSAKSTAEQAQTQADSALAESLAAQTVADEATQIANQATASAQEATNKANEAQADVDSVKESVESLETSITNAQTAADNAYAAAETAQQDATTAKEQAEEAITNANEAKEAATTAGTKADSAITKADDAIVTAENAQTTAETASATAAAAKADAEQAQADVDALGEDLETLSTTMEADYARKTDLTETEATLQTQITQNAAGISANASKIVTIDETANNAKETADLASQTATEAQTKADAATADALAAQTAADEARAAADEAQTNADTAKAAAENAQSVADKAETDLAAAIADLETVQGRVDATEEDIALAEQKVTAAQAAADKAQEDATTAQTAATNAQNTADTAVTNAATAQSAANEAASKAELAQATADEAKGDASAAQTTADEAALAAANAQSTADTAQANATTAQTKANEAATAAANAQQAADDADAKASQAATDLEVAKQNLANVEADLNSTQEEVEAAQAAVVIAQQAADDAQEQATAAQSTADIAKANAAQAQTDATNAQQAADNAQAAADEAQQAADKAQEDVDALAVRVTTAETQITQNADEIALRATKTEVAETLGGYYTKSEADAAITVKANEITQSVSETYQTKDAMSDYSTTAEMNSAIEQKANSITSTVSATYATKTALADTDTKATNAQEAAVNAQSDIDNLEIGGRNLLINSNKYTESSHLCISTATTDTALSAADLELYAAIEPGETYVLQATTNGTWGNHITDGTGGGVTHIYCYFQTQSNVDAGNLDTYTLAYAATLKTSGYITPLKVGNTGTGYWIISVPADSEFVQMTMRIDVHGDGTTVYDLDYWNFKLERGNKATDWTPAPEDMATDEELEATNQNITDLDDRTNERITAAESIIQQLSDSISMLVVDENGGSLMTQTDDGWTFNIGPVQDKLNEVSSGLNDLAAELENTDSVIAPLQQAVEDLENTAEYIEITTFEDEPCIALGESDSDYKLLITNTRIMFLYGSTVLTYINTNGLVTENIEVEGELKQGGFAWKVHGSGNLGLVWKGVS